MKKSRSTPRRWLNEVENTRVSTSRSRGHHTVRVGAEGERSVPLRVLHDRHLPRLVLPRQPYPRHRGHSQGSARVMVQSGSGFYLVNLILAIVAMSYDDCQKREQAEIEEEYAAALVHMYACLYGAHTQLEPCRTLPIRTRISSRT